MKDKFIFITILILILNVLGIGYAYFISNAQNQNHPFQLNVKPFENGWFYSIEYNSNQIINQKTIPAVKGTYYFQTKKEAEVIGRIVLNKLLNNERPTITQNEISENNIQLLNTN